MSDNHHELCPKCGFNEAEKIQDGVRCHRCGHLTIVATPKENLICPACRGSGTQLINEHFHGQYPIGYCRLFRCGSCEYSFTVKPELPVASKPPTTVMLSSGIVLSVEEARVALEEVRHNFCTQYGDPAGRDDEMDVWLAKYFPKSV